MNRILCILAHPDDAEIWAGGTLALHAEQGDKVSVITCFDHRPERLNEVRKSSRLLGYQHIKSDTPDYTSPNFDTLKNLVGKNIPDIVVTHWNKDCHLEHRLTFDVSLKLTHYWKRRVKKTPVLLMVSTYQMVGQDGLFEPDIIIDTSFWANLKTNAIKCHRSQHPEVLLADIQSQDRLLGLRIGAKQGEGFKELPLFGRHRTKKVTSLVSR